MNEYITIGQIVRAVGIRGELKVKPLTDDPMRFNKLKVLYLKEAPHRIEACRFDKDFVYLRLSGISDRNEAESVQNEFLQIDRINAIDLNEGSYFIADVIGCKVIDDNGEELGKVIDISQYGAADVYTVQKGKSIVRFPFLNKMIVKVDVDTGIIVLRRRVFDEVSVYED